MPVTTVLQGQRSARAAVFVTAITHKHGTRLQWLVAPALHKDDRYIA